ncbi:MAG: EamA family transporter, partial [Solirubrobacterales bacterium]
WRTASLPPMLPLVLAFGAGMGWGTADFLGGLSARRLPLITLSLLSQLAGLVFVGTIVAVRGEAPTGAETLLVGLAGGLVGGGGLAALYRALAIGRMSIVAPTAALSGVVPVAWGLFRGERPTTLQLVGVAVAVAGIVLAARTADHTGARDTRGLGLALVAAVTLGAFVVLLDESARGDPLWASLMVRTGAISMLLVAFLVRRPSLRMRAPDAGRLAAVGVLDNAGNLAFATAADAGGLLALTSVLGSLYPVATVVLARFVLHERLTRWQTVGVVAALAGVVLIAAG